MYDMLRCRSLDVWPMGAQSDIWTSGRQDKNKEKDDAKVRTSELLIHLHKVLDEPARKHEIVYFIWRARQHRLERQFIEVTTAL